VTPRAETRTLEVLEILAERGQHRAPSIPDLLIAAIAEQARLVVLHVDKDFELIAEVTGQPVERLP
jgi:predicted nucleic acid-binding protein